MWWLPYALEKNFFFKNKIRDVEHKTEVNSGYFVFIASDLWAGCKDFC